uniref:Glycin-rich RNA binding protein n=1 Tax=Polytomella sp. Pringsheim 198.80 TaxID=37502 RepID=Q8GU29_9CHLO|nr:glycine-rich RNA binding protein (grbA) [Polytomella parva]CAC86462.1 glycin-rich RNA binding protein [Polytomella sp. Pringsheim 198.80]|eukprot:CAMPEP_0175062444 /NCGR_PEP_ID=MMETSP0052_2-20121109/14172_1 /TAXON_ID=51329 ORGANISM="Polytomella parva, Strain SAG 63-3" /NCGR_SAMPLE_ID=MMETSP0052_2 /ASSEMBLY_ACC=CAM_ASM_000194 /LENGTH=177 /DNA_ID=CAMNT_0016328467 /DNA_START=17 /DNA_END=550 /DNA_ORIENTATION=-
MSSRLYVGNLSWNAKEEDLRTYFGKFGEVEEASIALDRESGRSRGFGFVTLPADVAKDAIEKTNGAEFMGRNIKVNEASPPGERPPRTNNYGGGYGDFNGNGGGRDYGRGGYGRGNGGYGGRNAGYGGRGNFGGQGGYGDNRFGNDNFGGSYGGRGGYRGPRGPSAEENNSNNYGGY